MFGALSLVIITQIHAINFKFKKVEKVAVSLAFERIEKTMNCIISGSRELFISVVFAVYAIIKLKSAI